MKKKIKFNSLYSSRKYLENLSKLFENYDLFRQKYYSNHSINELNHVYEEADLLLTHSATGALEIIALTLDIIEGDEIILPSFTFVSTANAFALRGAKLVFIDIETETLGIDPALVEQAITPKTKAIICTHYGGHACQIESLQKIAKEYKVCLIEDAATGFGTSHKNKALGTFGDFGVVSFDITKHISATQGGLLIINNKEFSQKATQIYHIGTNRNAFENGKVPYYEWVQLGSKYQMPETNAAILYGQLKKYPQILQKLQNVSNCYMERLYPISTQGYFSLMSEKQAAKNVHEFYIILKSKTERDTLAKHFIKMDIDAFFHYIPLHKSSFAKGAAYQFVGGNNTENISNSLLRLPMHTSLSMKDIAYICHEIEQFFKCK
ncbi:MAG: aminotransferase class I/II-fold pyridoxal phosphate-dependent enzyme [Chitinophagales bacterium]|nr:aminotransferase class I/II-fold pyridoxal phosphate-dependent enzyme [Chitinophagales bacterium]